MNNLDEIILLKIFNYLYIKDLLRYKQVCKKWSRLIGESIVNKKYSPQTILFETNKWNNSELAKNDFVSELNQELNYLKFEPVFGLFFLNKSCLFNCITTEENFDTEQDFKPKRKKYSKNDNRKRIGSILNNQLPKSILKYYVYVDGIIGSNTKMSKTLELESDYDEPCFTGLFLPKSKTFKFDIKELNSSSSLPELKTEQELNYYFNVDPIKESLKFVFILHDGNSKLKLNSFLKSLNKIRSSSSDLDSSFACSGGIVQRLANNMEKMLLFSLISIENSVKISQLVMPDYLSKESYKSLWEKKVALVKSSGFFAKNQTYFALQVSCCGRGKEFHSGEPNFESNLFKTSFPSVPLIGFFSYGEICVDHIPNFIGNSKFDKSELNLINEINCCGFTTIFTLVSIKNE